MNAREPIHQLQRDDDDGLDLKLALFKRFFQLLEIDAEELHDQVVIVLVRAV